MTKTTRDTHDAAERVTESLRGLTQSAEELIAAIRAQAGEQHRDLTARLEAQVRNARAHLADSSASARLRAAGTSAVKTVKQHPWASAGAVAGAAAMLGAIGAAVRPRRRSR